MNVNLNNVKLSVSDGKCRCNLPRRAVEETPVMG